MFTSPLLTGPPLFSLDKNPKNKYLSSRRLYKLQAKVSIPRLKSLSFKLLLIFSAFKIINIYIDANFYEDCMSGSDKRGKSWTGKRAIMEGLTIEQATYLVMPYFLVFAVMLSK